MTATISDATVLTRMAQEYRELCADYTRLLGDRHASVEGLDRLKGDIVRLTRKVTTLERAATRARKHDPTVFLGSVTHRGSRADSFAPEMRVLSPADVTQLFEAWQQGRLTFDEKGVFIATPGTGIAGIRWS